LTHQLRHQPKPNACASKPRPNTSRWHPLYDGNELRGWLHARRYVLGPRAVGPSRCVGQGRLRRWRTSGLSALALCCRSRGAAPIEVSGAPGVKG
jgi:hypothetical protein